MPVIELSCLHKYLCDGTIKTYTIDTNIIYNFNFNFNQYPLNIVPHPHKNINFILPDIVYQEIEKNYIEKYDIQKVVKGIYKLISIKNIEKIFKLLKSINIKKECTDNLDKFLDPKNDYVIEIGNLININEIMDMYFNKKAPFENSKDKKCEKLYS